MFAGIMIRGVYVAHSKRMRDKEVKYDYLVAAGTDSFKITSDEEYTNLELGDVVTFSVTCNCWNNKLYFNGKLLEE